MLTRYQEDNHILQDNSVAWAGGMEAEVSGRRVDKQHENKNDFNFIILFNIDFMLCMKKYICLSGRVKKNIQNNREV